MDNDEHRLIRPKVRRDWLGLLGFRGKTLWDLMGLLIVPLVILGATGVLSYFETERENKRAEALRQADRERADALLKVERARAQAQQQIEDDRVRQSVLQSYIQDMSGLLLDKGLATSKQDQPVRSIARSSTLTAVRQLDSDRKGILVQFLYESGLIRNTEDESSEQIDPIIDLSGADLRGTSLGGGADLSNANLGYADLTGANLTGAFLSGANLRDTDLSNANLSGANLSCNNPNLSGANLSCNNPNLRGANLGCANLALASLGGADLTRAFLFGAELEGATLTNTDLKNAFLKDANLRDTDLRGAEGWTNEQLAQAESLSGATLPDGTLMTEQAWEEFKKRYGQ
jgi:uncharacterized protein YjbI with pentapeptide repeats